MKKNILVTGAGAILGQGILRSLHQMDRKDLIIHSADPDYRSTGHWLAQKAHIIPFANHRDYIPVMTKIIREHEIDIVLVGTDTELPLFANNKEEIKAATNAVIVVSDAKVIDIANDKWKTALFLKESGFPYPQSVMARDKDAVLEFTRNNKLPFFAKPVDGARSKGIVVINSEAELSAVLLHPQNLVIQEFLPEDEGEFTAGCVVTGGICRAVVVLRRDLRDGNTYRAYYENGYERFNKFIAAVSQKLGVEGPCNFQFRILKGEPVIFEINSRFSGTTPIRFMFGFNEVAAIVENILDGKEISQPELKEGIVMRAWSDLFVAASEVARFRGALSVENPHCQFHPFLS